MTPAREPAPTPPPDEQLARLREAAERALAHAGAYEARSSLVEARMATGLARGLGRLEESAKALAAAGLAHYFQAEMVDAVLRALDAVRRSANDADLSRAWFVTCLSLLAVEAREEARVAARRALQHAVAADDDALVARAHSAMGFVASETGDHHHAVLALHAAARRLQGHPDRALYMKTLCNLARTLRTGADWQLESGLPGEARKTWRHAARLFLLALRIPAPAGDVIIAKGQLGETLLRLGEERRGLAVLEEGVALLGPDSLPWVVAETLLRLAEARMRCGDLEGATAAIERATVVCRDPRAVQSRESCHALHAELAGRLGRSDKAAIFRAYAHTAKHHRANELATARRQALTLWQRFQEGRSAPAA